MKQGVSILLLLILLFNIVGYRFAYRLLEKNATARLEEKINAISYTDEDLIEIRIPLNMPYYSDKDFEPAYGETTWNGQHYRFVKRKISGNVMHLLCLPHPEKNKIISDKNKLTRSLNDTQQENQQEHSVVKLIQAKYTVPARLGLAACDIILQTKKELLNSFLFSQFDPQALFQPPETA